MALSMLDNMDKWGLRPDEVSKGTPVSKSEHSCDSYDSRRTMTPMLTTCCFLPYVFAPGQKQHRSHATINKFPLTVLASPYPPTIDGNVMVLSEFSSVS